MRKRMEMKRREKGKRRKVKTKQLSITNQLLLLTIKMVEFITLK